MGGSAHVFLPGVICDMADPLLAGFSGEGLQVHVLRFLYGIVIGIDVVKFLWQDDLLHVNGLFLNLPAVLLQKYNALVIGFAGNVRDAAALQAKGHGQQG